MPISLPVFWLLLFVVLLVIEMSTYNFTTIWFALSCIPLIFISWFGLSWAWQLIIFVAISAALLIFTKPLVQKRFKSNQNPNQITGKEVTVIQPILVGERGRVKTTNGVTWNAVSDSKTDLMEGVECVIVKVKGNTLIVRPIEDSDNT